MPARIFLCVSAAYLLVLGIGGLMVNSSFKVGDDLPHGHLFGVIETNGWHNLAGVLLGAQSLYHAVSGRWLREGALAVALVSLVSGLIFLAYGDGNVALWLVPVDTADAVLLHVLPGAVGLICAAVTPRERASVLSRA